MFVTKTKRWDAQSPSSFTWSFCLPIVLLLVGFGEPQAGNMVPPERPTNSARGGQGSSMVKRSRENMAWSESRRTERIRGFSETVASFPRAARNVVSPRADMRLTRRLVVSVSKRQPIVLSRTPKSFGKGPSTMERSRACGLGQRSVGTEQSGSNFGAGALFRILS